MLSEPLNFSYTFKLTNNITTINLPYPLERRKHVKIKGLMYKTSAANMNVMSVKISPFNSNVYYDGTTIINCCKTIFLQNSIDTQCEYAPVDDKPDATIKEAIRTEGSKSLTIEIDIDGSYTGVSASYPVYLEVTIY